MTVIAPPNGILIEIIEKTLLTKTNPSLLHTSPNNPDPPVSTIHPNFLPTDSNPPTPILAQTNMAQPKQKALTDYILDVEKTFGPDENGNPPIQVTKDYTRYVLKPN
jgi:hypothetical protein